MGNTRSGRVNSKLPGYMANIHYSGDQNITPVPVIAPVFGDCPFHRFTIPIADKTVLQFNPTDPLPSPARTTGQATPSNYMPTEFLNRCFTCKREFRQRVEIFIYKDMSFCSDDCRNKEMEKDVEEEMKNHDKMMDNRRNGKTAIPKRTIFFIGDA